MARRGRSPIHRSAPKRRRWGWAAWLVAVTAGLLVFGAPLVGLLGGRGSAAGNADGERFPCERAVCGCTPERCWRDCCCNDPDMRLAWCLRERVIPPDYAVLPSGWNAARIAKVLYSEEQNTPAEPRGGLPVGGTPEKCQGKSGASFAAAPMVLPAAGLAWLIPAAREPVGLVECVQVRVPASRALEVETGPPRWAFA
jgi:hypothetical protein